MTQRPILNDARLFVGGYDLSGDANRVALLLDRAQLERTTFADKKDQVFQPGLKVVGFDVGGFWEAGAEAGNTPKKIDDIVFGNLDLVDVPATVLEEDAAGKVGYALRTATVRYRPGPGAHGALIPFDLGIKASNSPFLRGTCLHVGQVTATGSGTAFNLGAVSATQKLYAALHVWAFEGTLPTLDVKIQSDDAEAMLSPLDRITFAQNTGFDHEWPAAVAGAIADTWWRVSYTVGGTGAPKFSFALLVAIQ